MGEGTLVLELAAKRRDSVLIEWDLEALAGITRAGAADLPFTIAGGLDASRWELARVLSGAFADGRLLAIAALRPRRAAGHGEDLVAGALVRNGDRTMLDEVLISVESGPDDEPRRLGLELYEQPDSLPLRVAGDRSGPSGPGGIGFELRADGVRGWGLLAVLTPSAG
jgi:hypothetical protein